MTLGVTMKQYFTQAWGWVRYQINTAKNILDTILSMQPKEGGQQGGETREAVVLNLAQDMLEKLPPDYIQHEVRLKTI